MNLSVRIRTTSEKKYKPIADRDDPFGEAGIFSFDFLCTNSVQNKKSEFFVKI